MLLLRSVANAHGLIGLYEPSFNYDAQLPDSLPVCQRLHTVNPDSSGQTVIGPNVYVIMAEDSTQTVLEVFSSPEELDEMLTDMKRVGICTLNHHGVTIPINQNLQNADPPADLPADLPATSPLITYPPWEDDVPDNRIEWDEPPAMPPAAEDVQA